jgi:hypothetical protein
MYYNPSWFIASIFLFSTLVPFYIHSCIGSIILYPRREMKQPACILFSAPRSPLETPQSRIYLEMLHLAPEKL